MARLTDKQLFERLLAEYEPRIRNAFLESIADIRDNVVLREVVELLERGDINGAVEAMHLDAEAFGRLERAINEAYDGGGIATVENLPKVRDPSGNAIVFRWGVRNTAAEAWLRDHSAGLVTRIVEDQRSSIQVALSEGLSAGDNPRVTALNIVGRVSGASSRRQGGVIGLTLPQQRALAAARVELSSGDATALRGYLSRERRDRRFDRSIAKAIREGTPLDKALIDRIVMRYSDRLLQLRGEMLAQHETFQAIMKSKHDAVWQQIAAGKVDVQDVTKVWKHTPQENGRLQHIAMQGQEVAFDQPFIAPDGTRIRYPHDPEAPASHTLGCKCQSQVKIDFTARLVRQRRAA